MKKIIYTMLAVLFIIGVTGCGSKNKYMIRDTKEYNKVTKNFIGTWNANSFNSLIGDVYENVTMEFDFDTRTMKMSCKLSETILADKMLDWKEQYPSVKVDEYKVLVTGKWAIDSSGKEISFPENTFTVVIKGSGENFESFYAWEKTKMEATKAASKKMGGGLLGKMAQKGLQKGTGMKNYFPPFPESAKFDFSKSANTVNINSNEMMNKYNLKLTKQ